MVRRALIALLLLLVPATSQAQLGSQGTALDHLVGEWVMTGQIAGNEITHDVTAEWVLAGHYLRITDTSREKDENGNVAYDAIVYIGWDEPTERFACLWLDITGGGGIGGVIGYAEPSGDDLPFVWDTGEGNGIHNTFSYDRGADSWTWEIDNVRAGEASNFARVTLNRK